MLRRFVVLFALALVACSAKSEVKSGSGSSETHPAPGKPSFTLFTLAEVRGQIGPCGCTSDPLGDLSRSAKLIADARAAGPVLVLDAGSLLYAKSPIPPALDIEEEAKADLLVKTYKERLDVAAIGLGPADLAKTMASVRPARSVVNLKEPGDKVEAPKIIAIGGAKVGVFGVIAEDTIPGLALTDPVTASRAAIKDLRGKGAQLVIALVQAGAKKDATKLVKDIGGIDLAIAGLGQFAPEPDHAEPVEKIGDTWVITPVNRGQIIPRFDLTVRDGGKLADAIGPAAATARRAVLDAQLAAIDDDLKKFAADKSADPAFVKEKQVERIRLTAERDHLAVDPYAVPATGSFFLFDNVKVGKTLACDTGVQDLVTAFYKTTGDANAKAGAAIPVAAVAKGAAHYVGMDSCADCHQEAVDFWKKTVHANAWQTLVERGQQFDYECTGCHVTGYDKPGGTNMGHTDKLRDIQCETCHGPGSIHVDKGGLEKPFAIVKKPADDLCAGCHTKEHSDTFQHEAYLRDIVGIGHGPDARKALGEGPTGHSLRSAALDKAGRTLGAGCLR